MRVRVEVTAAGVTQTLILSRRTVQATSYYPLDERPKEPCEQAGKIVMEEWTALDALTSALSERYENDGLYGHIREFLLSGAEKSALKFRGGEMVKLRIINE